MCKKIATEKRNQVFEKIDAWFLRFATKWGKEFFWQTLLLILIVINVVDVVVVVDVDDVVVVGVVVVVDDVGVVVVDVIGDKNRSKKIPYFERKSQPVLSLEK